MLRPMYAVEVRTENGLPMYVRGRYGSLTPDCPKLWRDYNCAAGFISQAKEKGHYFWSGFGGNASKSTTMRVVPIQLSPPLPAPATER